MQRMRRALAIDADHDGQRLIGHRAHRRAGEAGDAMRAIGGDHGDRGRYSRERFAVLFRGYVSGRFLKRFPERQSIYNS